MCVRSQESTCMSFGVTESICRVRPQAQFTCHVGSQSPHAVFGHRHRSSHVVWGHRHRSSHAVFGHRTPRACMSWKGGGNGIPYTRVYFTLPLWIRETNAVCDDFRFMLSSSWHRPGH